MEKSGPRIHEGNMEQRILLDAKMCRARAAECRALANICPKMQRAGYIRLAISYEELAKELEEEVREEAKNHK
jgi:hypothetical protein